MPFTITAELPLGTYRAARADGQVEALPSVSRLYSALLSAAGFGPRAVETHGRLGPSRPDEQALRWLEDNPPDAVHVPQLQINTGRAIAYRDDGTLKKSKQGLATKKLPKHPDGSVAVAGAFCWTWTQDPPPQVAEALTGLCPDVPYLGTTESPVRLTTTTCPPHDVRATHRLDPDASMFGAAGQDLDVPVRGRLDELVTAHEAATGRPPAAGRDTWGSDEKSQSSVPTRDAVAVARYVPVHARVQDVPWPQVLLLPIDRTVTERDRVRWAVTVHQALIRAIGDGTPPWITGVYPEGAARPANRLAVQFVDDTMPVDLPAGVTCALAFLIPAQATSGDLAVLGTALASLTVLYGPAGTTDPIRVSGPVQALPGDRFRSSSPSSSRSTRASSTSLRSPAASSTGWSSTAGCVPNSSDAASATSVTRFRRSSTPTSTRTTRSSAAMARNASRCGARSRWASTSAR
jgi:CRISPR-associated protein Csb2